MRIENEELAKKGMKTQVMTYEGERGDTNSNNKLITAATDFDESSVCSKYENLRMMKKSSRNDENILILNSGCNCIGTSSGTENNQLLIDGYMPTDLVNSSSSLKRASV